MKTKHLVATLTIAMMSLTEAFSAAIAFNIDFGHVDGTPADTLSAAANQPGRWNTIANPSTQTLNDLSGSPTSVQIAVVANDFVGTTGINPAHPGNLGALLDDNFLAYDNGSPWSLTITGLSNGTFDFYYYAPSHTAVDTGTFTVNGNAAPNVVGSTTVDLVQGITWEVLHNVTVTNGTLSVSSTSATGFRGLSGIQLTQTPEPNTAILLVVGGLILNLSLRQRTA